MCNIKLKCMEGKRWQHMTYVLYKDWVEKEKKVEFLVEVLVGMGRKEELIKGKTCI